MSARAAAASHRLVAAATEPVAPIIHLRSPQQEPTLPVISRFYGIAIYMYPGDHPPPHFHARYDGADAQFSIVDGELIVGRPAPRVEAMVREWAKLRRAELLANWERAVAQQPLLPVPPLE